MANVEKKWKKLAEKVSGLAAEPLNEDETKAALIDPVLEALGWDPGNPREVKRQHSVTGGGKVDYALKLNGKVKLFVEAKALGEQLDDEKFKTQTLNYAKHGNVDWCVLTNGNIWRVYSRGATNKVDENLFFEVRLTDLLTEAWEEAMGRLRLLSKGSLREGRLDKEGRSYFTARRADPRVEEALKQLLAESSPELVALLREKLPKRFSKKVISVSLQRLAQRLSWQEPTAEAGTRRKVKGTYDYDHHFKDKPEEMKELYNRLHEAITQLAGDIKRTFRKHYIAYGVKKKKKKKNLVEVQVQSHQLKLFVHLPYADIPIKRDIVRDVSKKGHWGTGDTEVRLETDKDLDYAMSIIKQAYEQM